MPRTSWGPPRPWTGAELSAGSFAQDEVGCGLQSTLRDWARDSPVTAAPGIARSIIRFTVNVIPDPEHPDTADTLETMCDEHLVLAHAVHSAPGAHRVHPVRTEVRTTVHSVRSNRWACCARHDG
ncbi:hypothetical protein [Streptomyces sp. NPDC045714]|uniref:hypothetical protein n=1 Tax=Streptomyces sp. NPDC045714 TaxID=3154913 RepID=UPI0033FC7207